jgi:DNA-directed RNA polymerase subunit RPC12/RpoP
MMKPRGLKIKIGHFDCMGCGKEVPVRENNETKALSFSCQDCGMPGYAKHDGSDHYRNTKARIRPIASDTGLPPGTLKTPVPPAKSTILFG